MNYTPESLTELSLQVLKGFGCDEHEATIVAEHLVCANLMGHDSHGIGMLPMYGEQVQDGNLIPNQTPALSAPNGVVSVVDAKRGFGHRMALLALDHAMQTIPEYKVAVLAMSNSGHVSRVGTYSEYCAAQGYVSIHMVNVVGHAPLVAPFGAREAGFSTNPISMAMPNKGEAKPMLDLATSKVAFGKVRVASNKGEAMAPGCLVDKDGLPTTDPTPMAENRVGALSAFGDHKGSGLGIFVELLAGALASGGTVATIPYIPRGVLNGMFSVILDPAAFGDADNIRQQAESFSQYIKDKPAAKGVDQVLLPGEPEVISNAQRSASGVPVDEQTIQQIIAIGGEFSLDKQSLQDILQTT